ncbi:B-cell receptor CD22 isoform X2 [Astyanax mexicanus]|uniref:B-cell receptor CD22 isoform X2 n=1 Tax=Astyanax mexicanus TaxID=7994 RepID=UPI0020CAEDF7|nr:B-cell receptor CD22 isoform X2 [Astyanax mexicanus]
MSRCSIDNLTSSNIFQICSSSVLMKMLVNAGLVLMILLLKTGSQTLAWSVSYTPSRICAVQHSSVVLPCKLSYSRSQEISTYVWYHQNQEGAEATVVSVKRFSAERLTGASDKLEILDCSLTLKNVTQDSAGIYKFSISNNSTQDLTNQHGVTLQITDLKVDVESESDVVTVGQWVMLICGTCIPSVTVPNYVWHKDGDLHSEILGDNQLDLPDVRLEDEGIYSCSISGHEGFSSSAVNITVKSPPKSVSVSISPSGGIVEGSSVNLTCSSDANPPVQIYTWFKEGETSPVGFESDFSFIVNDTTSGRYFCEVQNGHGSLRSALMPVVLMADRPMILYVAPAVGCCAAVAVAVLGTVVFCLRSKKQNSNPEKRDFQNTNPYVEDDTYTTLDLGAKTNDDLYQTLELVHPGSSVNSDKPESSDYENVENVSTSHPIHNTTKIMIYISSGKTSNKVMETSQPCYE